MFVSFILLVVEVEKKKEHCCFPLHCLSPSSARLTRQELLSSGLPGIFFFSDT